MCLLTFGTGLPTRPSTEDGRQNTPETEFWLDYFCGIVVLNMEFLVIKEANLGKGQQGGFLQPYHSFAIPSHQFPFSEMEKHS